MSVTWQKPTGFWGNPFLLGEITGTEAEVAIQKIRKASEHYPYKSIYRVWPGPNSNTYISYLIRSAGNLHFGLPPTAIGKDYPMEGVFINKPSSGSGWQFSILGMIGIIISPIEGFRLNLLGLEFGLNPLNGELYWPGIGIL